MIASTTLGPGVPSERSSDSVNSSAVVARQASRPIPFASGREVEVRTLQVEHLLRLLAVPRRADASELHVQHGVRPVVEDDRRHVERLAGHRPPRLQRVHRAAVGLERDHAASRTRDGRADRDGKPLADRAAGETEPVVARRARPSRRPRRARRCCLRPRRSRPPASVRRARRTPSRAVSSPVGRSGRAASAAAPGPPSHRRGRRARRARPPRPRDGSASTCTSHPSGTR